MRHFYWVDLQAVQVNHIDVALQSGRDPPAVAQPNQRGGAGGVTLHQHLDRQLGFIKMLNKDLPYEPVKDFTPVALIGSVPVAIFINPASGILSIQDLVAAAKAKPGQLSYSSSTGLLSLTHLAGELFCQRADVKMIHVPYSGAQAQYFADLIGGRLQAAITGLTSGLALAREGKIKLIGIASRERSKLAPDAPAVGEIFANFDVPAWFAFAVAAGTPANIVQKLETATLAALRDPATRAQFGAVGVDLGPFLDSSGLAAKIAIDNQMWEKTFRSAGLMK